MEHERFFDWLAGFIDGEGHFAITKRNDRGKNRYGYVCTFHINLRADDYKILLLIRNMTGLGQVYRNKEEKRPRMMLSYKIFKREECLKLVEILDKHPLQAKKSADYAIWRLAVISCNDKNIHGGRLQSSPELWADVAQLAEMLKTARIYQEYDDIEIFWKPRGEVVDIEL